MISDTPRLAAGRFIADAMLGRLATWLRALGFDTEYARDWPKQALTGRAVLENRVLLTRNTRLLQERRLQGRCLFVSGDKLQDQLRQFLNLYRPDPGKWLSRCLRCNQELLTVAKDEIRTRVPPYVFSTQQNFSICPSCRRVYWKATHPVRMEVYLAGIK